MRHQIARAVAMAVAVVLSGLAVGNEHAVESASEVTAAREVSIPAGDLTDALKALAKQTSSDLVFRPEQVEGIRTEGVAGKLSAEEALKKLLQGTSLRANRDTESGAILIAAPQAAKPTAGNTGSTSWRMAQAGASTASESVAENLEEVVVRGYKFLSADTSGTTGLPLPIEKVPQSISLVSGDFIKAANLKTLGEIAEYTAGAINAGNPANNGSVIKLRGFSTGRAINGLNIQAFTSFEPDYAIYDRLEVVKGPTSVVYGVSSPGGLVNFVTKSATPQSTNYLHAQGGSWNSYRVEGQVSGSLDSADRVRVIGIGVRDQGDSFQHMKKHAKTSVYGGINVDLSDSVTAYLHGGYERFVRNGFDGIPTRPDGSPAPVPRSFFIGSPDLETTSSVYHVVADLTWHVTDLLELSVKGNYEDGKNEGSTIYGFNLRDNGNITLSGFRYDLPGLGTQYDNYAIGVSSIYRLDTLGLEDSFVSLAALYQDSRTGFAGVSPPFPFVLTRNIFDGESVITEALESLVASAVGAPFESRDFANTTTYSGQSVLKLTDPLSLLLGVAYSKPELTTDGTGGRQDVNFDSQVSYRAGATYELIPGTNAYVSFSQSFSPQNLSFLDDNGVETPLPPLEGEQYEAGVKYLSGDGRLLVTGAVFQIKQKNQGQFDSTLNGVDYFRPVGEVTHKGLELETVGQVTSQWQVNAGYAYLDPKVSEDSLSELEGQRRLYLPKHVWSVYTTYALPDRMLRGLTLGGGIRHVASQQTSYRGAAANNAVGLSQTIDLPAYTLGDVTASYAVNKWLLQLNARNVFDKHYFINNYQTLTFGNVVGDPANVTLTIRREF